MSKKCRFEKKISNDLVTLKLGSIGEDAPKVLYLEGRAYLKPLFESDDYTKEVKKIRMSLSKMLNGLTESKIFDQKKLYDFSTSVVNMECGKKSFFQFQYFFKQKSDKLIKVSDIVKMYKDDIDTMISNLGIVCAMNHFELIKSKT